MRHFPFTSLFIAVLMLVAIASCKPSLPSDVLSSGKMEDILYDYHLAVAMMQNDVEENGKSSDNMITYRAAILKKHGVTPAEFDSSMVYYMRHTELLHDVYKNLADRLNDETTALGGERNGEDSFGNLSSVGDTANIWRSSTSMVFMPLPTFDHESFTFEADTAFHKGDSFMLDFNAEFIYQDGMRDGVAVLAIQFKNDSVASQMIRIQNKQHYSLTIADRDSLGIKRVKGYFLLNKGNFTSDNSQTTLKLMFIQNIKLVRMHPQKKKEEKEKKDSVVTNRPLTGAPKPLDASNKNDAPAKLEPEAAAPPPPNKVMKMENRKAEPLKVR